MNTEEKETKVEDVAEEETNTIADAISDTNVENESEKKEDVTEEKDDLSKFTEKYEQLNDRYLRLVAEYDNFRKRTLREKSDLIKNGGEKSMIAILPVIDDFERGLEAMHKTEEDSAVIEGIELIYAKFLDYLKKNGIKPMETKEQLFDSEYHEAITLINAPCEEMKDKIIDCVQKGYFLNDKVIRFAKVVVGK